MSLMIVGIFVSSQDVAANVSQFDIINVRTYFGIYFHALYSCKQFSMLAGLAPPTFPRWESGTHFGT